MKRAIFSITICFSLFLSQFVSANQPPSESVKKNPSLALEKTSTEAKVRLSKTYGKLPLAFEANEGQTDEQVKFLSRGSGYSMFLTPTETVLSLSKDDRATAIRMGLVGANSKPKMAGEEKLPGKTNYLIGNDPKKWRTNISNYKKVRYEEVYPGIDLVYYGNQRKLEYDFIVKPGVDPKAIRMQFAGVDRMSVEAGDLVMHTDSGDVIQKAPIIYQEIDGKRKKVTGNYMFLADNQVGFYLGEYDKTRPLVIDPVLVYSTFLGGNSSDVGNAIAVDGSGNAYVTGQTFSANFSTTAGAFDTSQNGSNDVFVTKLNASGSALIYSTFIGGSSNEFGKGIAVDGSGNAYVTGFIASSVTNFPTTPGAFDQTFNGGFDVFVAKLNASGNTLIFSTFLGGNSFDTGLGIAVDGSGNAHVTGATFNSTVDFPTTPGAFDQTPNGPINAYVTKLSADGTTLIYSTFLGGGSSDVGNGIAVDASGNAYVTGQTASTDFPTQSPLATGGVNTGGVDAFVTKLNASGNGLIYSTYLGGGSSDVGNGITVNSSGNAYVTGQTDSTDFPTQSPLATGGVNTGGVDAFVTKLNASGSAMDYSTYLGGGDEDIAFGIDVDGSGNAYVTGQTRSTNFPIQAPLPAGGSLAGTRDVFVTKLNTSGSTFEYSTYLGDIFNNVGLGIAVDVSGSAYVTGLANHNTFPTTPGAFNETINGSNDAFVSKIGVAAPAVESDAGPDQTVDEGDTVNLDGTGSSPDPNTLNYDWTQVGGPSVTLTGANTATPSFDAPYVSSNQTLTFELIVDDGTNFSDPDTVDIVVVSVNSPPVADAGNDGTIKPGAVATLDGSNSFDPDSDPTITYQWTQVAGTLVTLSDDTAQQPTFTAPNAVGDVLVFKLQVSDGKESSTPSAGTDSAEADTVAITIVANSQPVADAGPDQTKDEGSLVTLAGSGSDSDGGDILSFQWNQTGGPVVTLSSTTSSSPTFTAPAVGPGGEDFTFALVVTDDDPVNPLASLPDEVTIHVSNINDPPSCDLAVANPGNLWPPNHKMIAVDIDGVMDADAEFNDVTLQVTSVTQDEPVNGLGDGDTSPDAVVQVSDPADSVLIRSERSGNENGRVYEINFTADDGFESCTGSVNVTVRHSRKSTAVDDGQNFDSTLP